MTNTTYTAEGTTIVEELQNLRMEMRTVRQKMTTVEIAWSKQTKRADKLEKENVKLKYAKQIQIIIDADFP